MKKTINRIICILCIVAMLLTAICFVACSGSNIVVTAKQETLELEQSAVEGYDYTTLFTVTSDGKAVTVTVSMIDSTAVKAEAGTYTVKCAYESKSASISVTVKAAGTTPSTGTDWGDWKDVHNAKSTIKTHADGTVTYRFQAEFTDLRGKGYAPGFSGTASRASDMCVPFGASLNEICISYLYTDGISVNFLVVSDRDVDNAELSLRLGGEYMIVPISPDVFSVRVDRKISDEDLYAAEAEGHEGAIGDWDDSFLNFYSDPAETDCVFIDKYECPAGSQIDGTKNATPGSFTTFKITSKLGLKKGVNCISIIIKGADFIDESNHGTMDCIAPCIDYMDIKTDAQLGFFGQYDNGYGTDGLTIVS